MLTNAQVAAMAAATILSRSTGNAPNQQVFLDWKRIVEESLETSNQSTRSYDPKITRVEY